MLLSLRLIALLLVGFFATGCDRQKAAEPQAPVAQAAVTKGLDRSHRGEAAPPATFASPDGRTTDIANFAGKPLLVNLWATWCAPCIKELPTLGVVASEESMGQLTVVAVNQDSGDQATVMRFLDARNIGPFAAFHDPDMVLSTALGVQVMPTTVLFDAAGREVWRYTGDLDWTGAEAKALLAEVSPATK